MNIEQLKQKLIEERARLEEELPHLAMRDIQNPSDWMATGEDTDDHPGGGAEREADESDLSDKFEDMGERVRLAGALEVRYNNVLRALERIERGTFGICVIGPAHNIEQDRLSANPAASTCKRHMSEKTAE